MYFNRVIKAYKEQKRGKAIVERNNLIKDSQINLQEVNEKDKDQQNKEQFYWMIEHYKENNSFPLGLKYSYAYDYAIENGLITITKEEKQSVRDEVKSSIESKIESLTTNLKFVNDTLKTMELSLLKSVINSKEGLKIRCKKHCIKKWCIKKHV